MLEITTSDCKHRARHSLSASNRVGDYAGDSRESHLRTEPWEEQPLERIL